MLWLHLVVEEAQASRIAGIVLKMLRHRCQARVDAPRRTLVEGRAHLERLVGYLAKQAERRWRHLPRRGEAWLLEQAGARAVTPVDPRTVAPQRIWEASFAANFTDVEGRTPATVEARAVVARVCGHLSSVALSGLVPMSPSTIRSLRTRYALEDAAIAATHRWLAIDAAARR